MEEDLVKVKEFDVSRYFDGVGEGGCYKYCHGGLAGMDVNIVMNK